MQSDFSTLVKNKQYILFDLDGTLVDSISVIVPCFQQAFKELGYDNITDVQIKSGIGKTLNDIFEELAPNLTPIQVEQAVERYRELYVPLQNNGKIPLLPGIKKMLEDLKAQGKTLGVVTTKHTGHAKDLLCILDALDYFEFVIGSCDVTNCKPHPEPLLLACQKLSITPDQTVYVGDSLHDAESDQAARMDFVGVLTGTGKKEDLQKFGEIMLSL